MATKKAGGSNGRDGPDSEERKESIRLSLDVSPELNDLLSRLAAAIGGTKSDVLRRSVALMEVAVEAKRQGRKLGIAEKNQQLVTEIVGI